MPLDPIETLQRLIRTPSVNPMGREPAGATWGESKMTELLESICQQQGWRWLRQRVHPGRDNLLIDLEGRPAAGEGGELILWDVHQDTVAADGMTVEPFGGQLREGRVYGRGASDVKGSMAAMLAALSRLTTETHRQPSVLVERRPSIVLACTVNEEFGFTGAKALADLWPGNAASTDEHKAAEIVAGNITVDQLFPRPPDAAIVAEPTGLNVVVAHQGVVRWRCHAIGRAAHTSRPDIGLNAIYAISRVVQAIEGYHKSLSAAGPEHPLCGRPSVCVSTIQGGVGINTVPERATIEIDRRLGPSEAPDAAYRQLVAHIAQEASLAECQIAHDAPFMQSAGLNDANNGQLAKRLSQKVQEIGRPSRLQGVSFGTDAAAIAAKGVPTVVFGPGSIRQAHTADEFIGISEVQAASEIFLRLAREGLR